MISFLRFIGLINAAVWLGAVVFISIIAEPAASAREMERLLGPGNFPFFSGAIAHIVLKRYFIFLGVTAVIALFHLLAEWLYMGRPARTFSTCLLGGLLVLTLVGGFWVEPHLARLHVQRFSPNASLIEQQAAAKNWRIWHAGFELLNVGMIAGLVVYTWRLANPSDAPRFISSIKFRG